MEGLRGLKGDRGFPGEIGEVGPVVKGEKGRIKLSFVFLCTYSNDHIKTKQCFCKTNVCI